MENFESKIRNKLERKENPGILVWVVDDDKNTRESLAQYLKVAVSKEIQLAVESFADGESAIEAINSPTLSSKPDIITLDGDLGDDKLKGEEVARNIAGLTDSLIVAMSSSDTSNKRIEQFALDAVGRAKIVGKINFRELARLIEQVASGDDMGNKN
jgi:DNA-binding response OmpR family regulator